MLCFFSHRKIVCRLAGGKKYQPSIMVGTLKGSYYALPLMNEEQKSGLLAIMPANATRKVEQEAGNCEDQPCDELPDEVAILKSTLVSAEPSISLTSFL